MRLPLRNPSAVNQTPMTWTIGYQDTYTTTTTLAGGRAPWDYYFDTWLVSKGWTVTNENGGMDASTFPYNFSETLFKGVEKTLTDALGVTKLIRYVIALTFDSRYVSMFPWDGTVGGGVDPTDFWLDTSNSNLSAANNEVWRFLESDEDTDHWMVQRGSNKILSYSFPFSQTILTVADDTTVPNFVRDSTSYSWIGKTNQLFAIMGGSSFSNPAYIVSPNFVWAANSYYDVSAINSMTDILVKVNGTVSASVSLGCSAPASLLIGSKYYMDLTPSASVSFLIDTGLVDLGLFN